MNLLNQFLIASPSAQSDPYFANSLVYIVQEHEQGVMGIVLNKVLNINLEEILNKTAVVPVAPWADAIALSKPALAAGPVSPNSIITLHQGLSGEYQWSAQITDNIAITFSFSKHPASACCCCSLWCKFPIFPRERFLLQLHL